MSSTSHCCICGKTHHATGRTVVLKYVIKPMDRLFPNARPGERACASCYTRRKYELGDFARTEYVGRSKLKRIADAINRAELEAEREYVTPEEYMREYMREGRQALLDRAAPDKKCRLCGEVKLGSRQLCILLPVDVPARFRERMREHLLAACVACCREHGLKQTRRPPRS